MSRSELKDCHIQFVNFRSVIRSCWKNQHKKKKRMVRFVIPWRRCSVLWLCIYRLFLSNRSRIIGSMYAGICSGPFGICLHRLCGPLSVPCGLMIAPFSNVSTPYWCHVALGRLRVGSMLALARLPRSLYVAIILSLLSSFIVICTMFHIQRYSRLNGSSGPVQMYDIRQCALTVSN